MREYCDNCGDEIHHGHLYYVIYAELKGYEEELKDETDCTKMCKKCYGRK